MILPRANKAPIDGYVDPTIPNPNKEEDSPIIIYGYTPTLALSALALALYALLLILYATHIFPLRSSSRPFTILILVAIVFEIVGYAFRLRSSPPPTGDPYNTINFIVQYFFIVVAPVFISAGIYTIVTSLIRHVGVSLGEGEGGGKYAPLGLKRRGIVWVFVVCDIVATVVQVAGAALIGVSESNRKSPDTGNNILLAGLAFQVFSFALFLAILGIFLAKTRGLLSTPELQREGTRGRGVLGSLNTFVAVTVVASLLVYLRTIFRLAETAQGVGGYASSHEAFFGALEFAPIVLAIALMGLWHPGQFVGKRKDMVVVNGDAGGEKRKKRFGIL